MNFLQFVLAWFCSNQFFSECFVKFFSFESWFDFSTITSDVENLEREQNVLCMLHQVRTKQKQFEHSFSKFTRLL